MTDEYAPLQDWYGEIYHKANDKLWALCNEETPNSAFREEIEAAKEPERPSPDPEDCPFCIDGKTEVHKLPSWDPRYVIYYNDAITHSGATLTLEVECADCIGAKTTNVMHGVEVLKERIKAREDGG